MGFGQSVSTSGGVAGILLLLALLLVIGPWLLFWSVGAMAAAAGYTFAIPLTFKTWLAAVIFLALVKGSSSS